jgi:Glycosyltransferase family 87
MPIITRNSRSLREQTHLVILALFACLGILYLAPKLLPSTNVGEYFDFQNWWIVAKIWQSGRNPYDVALFQKQYYEAFNKSAGEVMWLYPPYWYPLIVPFAFLPFKIAFGIWKVINFSLLIGATHLIARALADVARQKYILIFLAGVGFACFMQATAMTVWGGQTSILVYFGLSAMIFGLLKARPHVLIIGLVFLALKPQIGIIAFAAVAALHRYRWTIFPAVGLCLLGSAPVAVAGGYRASVEGFLANLALQSKTVSMGPDLISGVIRILDYQSYISNTFLIGLTVILSAIIFVVVDFYNSSFNNGLEVEDAQHQVASLALFVAITFFFVPLHYYDLVPLAAMWMMILAMPLAGRWLIAIGLLICLRPANILGVLVGPEAERAAGGSATSEKIVFPISHLLSLGLFLLFVGAVWSVLVRRTQGSEVARRI